MYQTDSLLLNISLPTILLLNDWPFLVAVVLKIFTYHLVIQPRVVSIWVTIDQERLVTLSFFEATGVVYTPMSYPLFDVPMLAPSHATQEASENSPLKNLRNFIVLFVNKANCLWNHSKNSVLQELGSFSMAHEAVSRVVNVLRLVHEYRNLFISPYIWLFLCIAVSWKSSTSFPQSQPNNFYNNMVP